jgi:hypothetical protein
VDLNHAQFLKDWFALGRDEAWVVLKTIQKIQQLEWNQVYRDPGLRWEAIMSRTGPEGQRLYSLRLSQRARAVVCRAGDFMRFLSLHPDHDSAYQ